MKFSILLNAQNTNDSFNQCILSILNSFKQTKDIDLEILIFNKLDDITYIDKDNIDIQYFENKDYNFSIDFESNQFLFEKATGDFVYLLDDDVIVTNDFFESLIPFFINYDIIIFKYMTKNIDYNNLTYNRTFPIISNKRNFQKKFDGNKFYINQIIFKKTALIKLPGPTFNGTDYDVFKTMNGELKVVNKTLIQYIINDTI